MQHSAKERNVYTQANGLAKSERLPFTRFLRDYRDSPGSAQSIDFGTGRGDAGYAVILKRVTFVYASLRAQRNLCVRSVTSRLHYFLREYTGVRKADLVTSWAQY